MSFWDSLKPATAVVVPTNVTLSESQLHVDVTWQDGTSNRISSRRLRQYCPCAECVEEWSGRRTFEVTAIPETMKVLELSLVGRYAVTFTFGDMHRTGIFNWATLLEIANMTT